jgi:hypothetical protein
VLPSLSTILDTAIATEDLRSIAYIVDKMKTIFAMEPGYRYNSLQELLSIRSRIEEKPDKTKGVGSGKSCPVNISARLMNNHSMSLSEKYDMNRMEARDNIVGMTLFSRYGKYAGYSLTPPSGTNVYADLFDKIESIDDQHNDLLNRYIESIAYNPVQLGIVMDCVKSKVPDKYHDAVTLDNIAKLLRGQSIDVEGEKFRLIGNLVIYASGECVNPSV